MTYQIKHKNSVFKDLKKIPRNIIDSIVEAINSRLTAFPHKFGKPLKGEWKGCYRLRVGDYRIIYEINDLEVIVIIIKIGNRDDVYE